MCGIALTINGTIAETNRMGLALKHRGNYQSTTVIDNLKVYFTWLPITDAGTHIQPFKFGKYTVWMNGFISNHTELAAKYKMILKSECDTEVLAHFLHLFDYSRLHELNGFFSVVAYDGKEVKLFTDRYGIKQLYMLRSGETTYVASEVKAIAAVKQLNLSPLAVCDWKYSLGVMNSNTIYQDIERVPCLPFVKPEKIDIGFEYACVKLSELLRQSAERNAAGNVASGVFLSGGVDSGLLASIMNPDYCFSVDYTDEKFSETYGIKLNSRAVHYTLMHNRYLFEQYGKKTLEALDDLKAGSCYTNFALTELASKFCTIIYSGAGGDEVFSGYTHRYSKPIDEVIKRSVKNPSPDYNRYITHKEYDWQYLKAILVVEDRMSGFHTMETRYPLLDNDLVDFALSLPDEYLQNKRILKEVSGLPLDVLTGKKRGFSNPVDNDQWIDFTLNNLYVKGSPSHLV